MHLGTLLVHVRRVGMTQMMRRFAAALTLVVTTGPAGSKGDEFLPLPPGGVVYPVRARNDTSSDYPFLPEWEKNLAAGADGCNSANTGHWNWRVSGLGCNMVRELNMHAGSFQG